MIHSFLRSIGFREMKKSSDVYELLEEIINHPDIQQAEVDQNGNTFIECKKEFGDGIGIAVCGDYLDNTEFHMQYYYPYLLGTSDSTWEPVEIERHAEKESYAGICDDVRLGVTLIFYVQNHTEVMRERKLAGHYRNGVSATLSGLASYGKILLPIQKTAEQIEQRRKSDEHRIHLITEAREGNPVAMEHLTLQDMDVYTSLSRRVMREDIFSIVESSFMPYGIESDQYTVLGEILDCRKISNHMTGEEIWNIALNCNNILFDVCINAKDLLGEPAIGRRLRAQIWLQGKINY